MQRTACLGFPHGARFTNHMVMSNAPIDWDFQRWQQVLEAYRIDGRPTLNLAQPLDRSVLEQLMSWETNLVLGAEERRDRPIESCRVHPRPHRRQEYRHRRQHGQRVAEFPRAGVRGRFAFLSR